MNTIQEIFVSGKTTTAQVAAQVTECLAENHARYVVVKAEKPDWRQARAAFAAGASDYLPTGRDTSQLHYLE